MNPIRETFAGAFQAVKSRFGPRYIVPEVMKENPAGTTDNLYAELETQTAIKKMLHELGFEPGMGADVMREIFRQEIKILEWRRSIEDYESIINPDREPLQTMFLDVADDSQVLAKTGKIIADLRTLDFQVFQGETMDKEKTKLLKQRWFRDLIKFWYESMLYGYTLVGMDTNDNPKNIYVPLVVDRRFVYPDFGEGFIMTRSKANKMPIDAISELTLEFGEKRPKGLFNAIMPFYIYKKQGFTSWAMFLRKMGVPIPFIETDLTNDTNLSKYEEGFKNIGNKSWFTIQKEDKVHFHGGVAGKSAHEIFDKMIDRSDAAISKILEGQTMTTDDGSSKSQADVHSETARSFFTAFKDEMLIDFNDQLIERLAADGHFIGTEEIRVIESTDTAKLIEWVGVLAGAGFNVDTDWLEEKTGIKLDEIQATKTAGEIVASYSEASDVDLSPKEAKQLSALLQKLGIKK